MPHTGMTFDRDISSARIDTPPSIWGNPFLDLFLATGPVACWFMFLAFFAINPHWDLLVSSGFFDAELCAQTANNHDFCQGFPAATDPILRAVRKTLQAIPPWVGLGILAWIVADWRVGLRWRDTGMLLRTAMVATLIIWPLLIVNGVLKAFWGRPRPWQSEPFGGDWPFVEAGLITDYCASNCSFVSGEAASAGLIALLPLLFSPHYRLAAALLLIPCSLLMAGLRVSFGAHYASDVLLGYWGTIAVFALTFVFLSRYTAKA